MNREQIQKLVGSVSKALEGKETLAIPFILSKLSKASSKYPYDQTIGTMTNILEKMADKNVTFIKKSELKDLYNKLYSKNTKAAEILQEELGDISVKSNVVYAEKTNPFTNNLHSEFGDQVLSHALESVFDKNKPLKLYSKEIGEKSCKLVYSSLDDLGLNPSSIDVADGNENFILVRASYDTPKGITNFYVPVEIKNKKLLTPSLFMGNNGPQDLDHTNIKNYITSFAGNKLEVAAEVVLEAIVKAASQDRVVSDAEIALIKLRASRQQNNEFASNYVVGQKLNELAKPDVSLPKTEEVETFEQKFNSPKGYANFTFGENVVKSARDAIVRQLMQFGYKNPQVALTEANKNTIFYGVSLDGKVAFKVPVKIENNKVKSPTVLISNGSINQLSAKVINELYSKNQLDYKIAAAVSPLSALKPADLVDNVRQAMVEENHSKAEDALNVLSQSNDAKAYATAFDIYMQGLKGKLENKHADHQCSMIVKNAHSKHELCGHTGLPLHKVYTDKMGNCRPMYRREMDETYQGAYFLNSKIFG